MKIDRDLVKGQDSQTTTYSISKSKEIKSNHLCSLEKCSEISSGLLTEIQKLSFLYQVWPGKNVFLFNGRLMFGPNAKIFIIGVIIFLGISLPFFIFIFPENQNLNLILINICAFILFSHSCISLILTAFVDPGIIPRRKIFNWLDNIEGYLKLFENLEKKDDENSLSPNRLCKTAFLNGKICMMKENNNSCFFSFCQICKIYKPPLSKHCKFIVFSI